jgi:hypothetical protein
MTVSSWIGISGSAVLLSATAMTLMRARHRPAKARYVFFFVPLSLAFFPLGGLPIAGYLRGVVGDLSVTTWILLIAIVLTTLTEHEVCQSESFTMLTLLVMLGGLVLYPSALGLTYMDTYALGYGSKALQAVVFSLSLISWYREYYLVTICLTASVLAYSLSVFESRNLWDYTIDPIVTLYALAFWSRIVFQNLRKRSNQNRPRDLET